jgi:hypothetical protein
MGICNKIEPQGQGHTPQTVKKVIIGAVSPLMMIMGAMSFGGLTECIGRSVVYHLTSVLAEI